ncbi:response regulator [Sulfurimonas marina]|uniref:histidine kinase n=1 Tax=Sulfurimonas marina TaxID=2590551 RepID=A0A7M1ATB1_9BACT|nr:response regulator [Sulfurimonas marina]QOP40636.1 response regulator [Sulfurimonas marina]
MGFFSIFSSNKTANEPKDIVRTQETFHSGLEASLGREFFLEVADENEDMLLYFLQGTGWIGANETFLKKMNYHDISDFNRENESIRDIFLNESEEIFTESDKSWLDYIRKYKKDGYRVSILDKNSSDVIMIDAKAYQSKLNSRMYVLHLKDVTDIYKAEQKTKEIEKLKTKFLANIGHEFRTPMNGILGFVDLLEHTHLDSQQSEYINMIHRSSKSLMTNIETLLDLAQLQSGRLELSNEPFNLLPLVEMLSYSFCKQGKEKGIKVMSFVDPKIPEELNSDSKKIMQILNALASNAIKFTPRGGKVIIEVKLLKRQQNGDCSIGFSVKDTGQGISEEQIALINEPFTPGNQADERLGVGLSLSSGLVKLLGSDLRITSDSSGTYVNFVLNFKNSSGQNYKMMPKKKVKVLLLDQSKIEEANFLTIYLRAFALDVVKSNQLDEHVYEDVDALYIVANQNDSSWILELGTYFKKIPVSILLDENEKLQTKLTHIVDDVINKPLLPSYMAKHLYAMNNIEMHIEEKEEFSIKDENITALVVEDNMINQRLIKLLLQGYNIDVETAANGLEAVQQYKKHNFDIVFMDIDMPQMNGIVATKEIKAVMSLGAKKTPIVALTALSMDGDREMILSEGLDDYLSKPLTRDKLELILEKHLKVHV